ncbi:5-oxoprolinase subunit C family protein [Yoonia litorea]|uniref:Allophanate hydrolase n=1 Tax=Yoonia litorea TaxID=1123755 RepID=A0A1I6L4S8_9RHOB|nr:biotin-dependent carboxyltransferase family protein [Yoonia litorea]SFR98260.1 allophanate hydrolase [Yoonia litorea]
MPNLSIIDAGPGLTVQDLGRPGWKACGLSTGGAADRLALFEAAALLGTSADAAVIEMMGYGGNFRADDDTRFVVTGAEMAASLGGEAVLPNTVYVLPAGEMLTIRGAKKGVYGYLAVAGGIQTEPVMDSRATHLTAAIGRRLQGGDVLPIGADQSKVAPFTHLQTEDRFSGGVIRVMAGPQTDFFARATIEQFANTDFLRSQRGNRQGVRLSYEGDAFAVDGGLNLVSDLIVPGDIQIAGSGVPYILLAECQTIGGYPRIGSVIPEDLPRIAQATTGTHFRFRFIDIADADATAISDTVLLRRLSAACKPRIRDPHDIADLASYQLISGTTAGDDLEGV